MFWKSARPYQTDWRRGNTLAVTLRNITTQINETRAALEREVAQKKTRQRYRTAKLYLKRVVALFVWR